MPDYRVEGKNILDPGFGGSNVRNMESGRFDKEQSQKLVKNIKAALDPETKRTNEALRKIAESIGKNTIAFQEAAQNWTDSDRKNAKSYINAVAQNKKGFKARLQRESLAAAAPDGIDTSNDLKNTGYFAIKEKGVLASIKEGLFGTKDPNDPQAKAKGGFFQNQFGAGAWGSSGFLGLGSTAEGKRAAAARRAGVDTLKGQGPSPESLVMEATDVLSGNAKPVSVNEVKAKKDKEKIAEKGTQKVSNSGVDKETPAERQSELLEEIRDELKKLNASAEGGMFGGGGGGIDIDVPLPRKKRFFSRALDYAKRVGKRFGKPLLTGATAVGGTLLAKTGISGLGSRIANSGAGQMASRIMPSMSSTGAKSFAGAAGRFGGPVLAAGLAGYEGYRDFNATEDRADAGELDVMQEHEGKVQAITEATGGFGGTLAGAAVGMAVAGPVGAIIGGTIGYFAGKKAGEMAADPLADRLNVDEGMLTESNAQARAMMDEIEEKNPELAGRIQASADEFVQKVMTMAEEEGTEWSAKEQEIIKNAGIVSALQAHEAEIESEGIDRQAVVEALKIETEAGFESAKESGLYDEDFFGNSEIDRSKLGDATEAELRAIIQDNDLSESDMEAVKAEYDLRMGDSGSIEITSPLSSASEIQNASEGSVVGTVERSVLPTGDAVDNMTEAASAQQNASAAPVINNITNNTTNPTSKPIVTNPVTPRSINSSLERLQNQRSVFLMG